MTVMTLDEICALAPVVPVITIERVEDAEPLARALVAGGLPALEVTLRTDAAWDAIHAMQGVSGAVVGVGTLMNETDVERAAKAGCRFGVSPGSPGFLLEAAREAGLSILPGVATPTEAMDALRHGCTLQKFFPAEANGGVPVLKAWAAPLAGIRFCPTGGVSLANARDYLALSNVACVGGSWVVPGDLIGAGDWSRIEELAREAAALR